MNETNRKFKCNKCQQGIIEMNTKLRVGGVNVYWTFCSFCYAAPQSINQLNKLEEIK